MSNLARPRFPIIDGAMNDLFRPACTTPTTTFVPVVEAEASRRASSSPMNRCGPSLRNPVYLCQTAHECQSWLQGDLVAFRSAGYGAVMASDIIARADPRGLCSMADQLRLSASPTFDEIG